MASIHPAYRTPHGLTDDLRRRLMQEANGILGTVNPDGSPHMTELLFSLDGQDRVQLPTPHNTRKVKNLRSQPVASFFVSMESGGWVSCTGTVRLVEAEEAAAINKTIRQRLLTEAGLATIGLTLEAEEDTAIEITPTKWLSWNSAALIPAILTAGGDIESHPPSTWWRDLSTDNT